MSNFYYVTISNQSKKNVNGHMVNSAAGDVLDKHIICVREDGCYFAKTYLKLPFKDVLIIAQGVEVQGNNGKEGQILVDYITGRKLNMAFGNKEYDQGKGYISDKVLFDISWHTDAAEVASILRSLSKRDIYDYAEAFDELERGIKNAYPVDLHYFNKDENYINDFQKKFWK